MARALALGETTVRRYLDLMTGVFMVRQLPPSMRNALADLKLDELLVIYPGTRPYPLSDRARVVPLTELVA